MGGHLPAPHSSRESWGGVQAAKVSLHKCDPDGPLPKTPLGGPLFEVPTTSSHHCPPPQPSIKP